MQFYLTNKFLKHSLKILMGFQMGIGDWGLGVGGWGVGGGAQTPSPTAKPPTPHPIL